MGASITLTLTKLAKDKGPQYIVYLKLEIDPNVKKISTTWTSEVKWLTSRGKKAQFVETNSEKFTKEHALIGITINPAPEYRSKLAIKVILSSWEVTMNPTEAIPLPNANLNVNTHPSAT